MSSTNSTYTRRLWRHAPLQYFVWSRGFSEISSQILTVAIGWQVYATTNSAFDLGMAGLVQFLPTAILVFIAGHASDRHDRKRLMQICQMVQAAAAAFLAWGSYAGWLTISQMFATVALFGIARAFESPAAAALLTGVAPEGMLQKATALSTGVFQLAAIAGPAVGAWPTAFHPSCLMRRSRFSGSSRPSFLAPSSWIG